MNRKYRDQGRANHHSLDYPPSALVPMVRGGSAPRVGHGNLPDMGHRFDEVHPIVSVSLILNVHLHHIGPISVHYCV